MKERIYLSLFVLIGVLLGVLIINIHAVGSVDRVVIHLVDRLPSGLNSAMKQISSLGTSGTLIEVAVLWAVVELAAFRSIPRGVAAGTSLLSLLVFNVLKDTIRRSRPVTEFVRQNHLHDFSFPSGHATGSIAVYGVIGLLIFLRIPKPYRYLWLFVPVLIIVSIGISRIYLGAHFPTDVIGGWLLGSLVVLVIFAVLERVEKRLVDRRKVDRSGSEHELTHE